MSLCRASPLHSETKGHKDELSLLQHEASHCLSRLYLQSLSLSALISVRSSEGETGRQTEREETLRVRQTEREETLRVRQAGRQRERRR